MTISHHVHLWPSIDFLLFLSLQIQSTVPRTWTWWTSVPVSWPCSGRPSDTPWHAATASTWPYNTSMCSTNRSLLLRSWYRPPLITLWGDSGLSWRSDYDWCWPTPRAARRARRSSNRRRKTVSGITMVGWDRCCKCMKPFIFAGLNFLQSSTRYWCRSDMILIFLVKSYDVHPYSNSSIICTLTSPVYNEITWLITVSEQ